MTTKKKKAIIIEGEGNLAPKRQPRNWAVGKGTRGAGRRMRLHLSAAAGEGCAASQEQGRERCVQARAQWRGGAGGDAFLGGSEPGAVARRAHARAQRRKGLHVTR